MVRQNQFSGYVVQSKKNNPLIANENDKYYGISRFVNWPLEEIDNIEAKCLSEEAYNAWFCFDGQMWFVPNLEFVQKYIACCRKLSITTRILFIEDASDALFRESRIDKAEVYGYDYSGGDLSVSLLYSDLFDNIDPVVIEAFRNEAKLLNKYGLFSTYSDALAYVNIRKHLNTSCLEEIYAPRIIRTSVLHDI